MSSRNLFPSMLMACSLAVGFAGIASAVNAESPGLSFRKSANADVNKIRKHGRRGVRIRLPTGSASVYHDYPYYYCRGYYPTHIGGYVYYPYYFHGHSYYCRYSLDPTRRQKARRK